MKLYGIRVENLVFLYPNKSLGYIKACRDSQHAQTQGT